MHAPRRLQLLSAEGHTESPSRKLLEFENRIPLITLLLLLLANRFSCMDPLTLPVHDSEPMDSSVGSDAQKEQCDNVALYNLSKASDVRGSIQ